MHNLSELNIGIRNVLFGEAVTVINPVNIYECEIGNRVFIGPFTEIQSESRIGDDTKIQSHTFICSLVTIGNNCFIGHGVVFINDTFKHGGPARGNKSKWKRTLIGDRVSIGSNSTILPVSITNDVVIGAGAVVTKDIYKSGFYVGNPAKLLRSI